MTRGVLLIVILGLAALIGAAGCGNKDDAQSGPEVPAKFAAARKTFDMNCAKCHTIGSVAPMGAGKKKGPDLGKVAALPEHTRDWIVAYIRDPESRKPDSKMPKFGEKLSADDIGALADYLATLK